MTRDELKAFITETYSVEDFSLFFKHFFVNNVLALSGGESLIDNGAESLLKMS